VSVLSDKIEDGDANQLPPKPDVFTTRTWNNHRKDYQLTEITGEEYSFEGTDLSAYPVRNKTVGLSGEVKSNFSAMEINGVSFKNAKLAKATFAKSTLEDVNFANADLTGVNFTEAVLQNVNFSGATIKPDQLLPAKQMDSETARKHPELMKGMAVLKQHTEQQGWKEKVRAFAASLVGVQQQPEKTVEVVIAKPRVTIPAPVAPVAQESSEKFASLVDRVDLKALASVKESTNAAPKPHVQGKQNAATGRE
jgi:hypothetical protein